jgi:hypothetical protein
VWEAAAAKAVVRNAQNLKIFCRDGPEARGPREPSAERAGAGGVLSEVLDKEPLLALGNTPADHDPVLPSSALISFI